MTYGTLLSNYDNYVQTKIDWSATPDQDNNRSAVITDFWVYTAGSLVGTLTYSVSIGGVSVVSSQTTVNLTSQGWYKIGSWIRNVDHDENGDLTVAIGSVMTAGAVGTFTISGSVSGDHIDLGMVYIRAATSAGAAVRGQVYVGNASKVPLKAKEVWVGNANKVPVKAK